MIKCDVPNTYNIKKIQKKGKQTKDMLEIQNIQQN
jgi:hypothetical protein